MIKSFILKRNMIAAQPEWKSFFCCWKNEGKKDWLRRITPLGLGTEGGIAAPKYIVNCFNVLKVEKFGVKCMGNAFKLLKGNGFCLIVSSNWLTIFSRCLVVSSERFNESTNKFSVISKWWVAFIKRFQKKKIIMTKNSITKLIFKRTSTIVNIPSNQLSVVVFSLKIMIL